MRQPESALLAAALALALGACASNGEAVAKPQPGPSANSLSAEGRTNLGLAQGYLDAGQVEKARERAELAQASDPGSADVHALLGMLSAQAGKNEQARREFERAVAIAPDDGSILNVHASWLCGEGRFTEADAQFERALRDKRYRTPVQAMANAGKCAHRAKRWSIAEDYFRRAIALSPDDASVLFLLADTSLRQGKMMEAQAFIQRRDALGGDAETLELAARIEDAAGNEMAAARYRERLRIEFPDYVPTGEGARAP